MEVIHMVPFTVRERDQQIWLKGADASPLERGEVLTYYLNMDMRQLRKWSNDIRHAAVGLEAFHPNVGKYEEHIHTMYRLQHEVLLLQLGKGRCQGNAHTALFKCFWGYGTAAKQ